VPVPVLAAAAAPVWRLSGRDEFARLRREGRRVRSGPLWVQWAPPAAASAGAVVTPPRCAYAIGRAVGGAVVRNRLRRRIRGVLATLDPPLPVGDYLVGATPAAACLTSAQLRPLLASVASSVSAAVSASASASASVRA
jgi:ribonuclease P protein component